MLGISFSMVMREINSIMVANDCVSIANAKHVTVVECLSETARARALRWAQSREVPVGLHFALLSVQTTNQ